MREWTVRPGNNINHKYVVFGDYADEGEPDEIIEILSHNAAGLARRIADALNTDEVVEEQERGSE